MPVGRPHKFKAKYCRDIIEHMKTGASVTSFAASINVCRSTIDKWSQTIPEFNESVRIAKAHCTVWWEERARDSALSNQGSSAMIQFGLRNMAPDDWSDMKQVDLKSSDNSMTPKSGIDASKLSDATLQELLNAAGDGEHPSD